MPIADQSSASVIGVDERQLIQSLDQIKIPAQHLVKRNGLLVVILDEDDFETVCNSLVTGRFITCHKNGMWSGLVAEKYSRKIETGLSEPIVTKFVCGIPYGTTRKVHSLRYVSVL